MTKNSFFCLGNIDNHLFLLCSDQEERTVSVEQFVQCKKDVLVATDIASKGLDFPNIQHVINYDMPEDIENYGKDSIVLFSFCLIYCDLKLDND